MGETPTTPRRSSLARPTPHIGVRIAVSGTTGDRTCRTDNAMTLVECLDASASTDRPVRFCTSPGYQRAGTGTRLPPLVRQVDALRSPRRHAPTATSRTPRRAALSRSRRRSTTAARSPKESTVDAVVGGTSDGAHLQRQARERGAGSATLPAGSGSNVSAACWIECNTGERRSPLISRRQRHAARRSPTSTASTPRATARSGHCGGVAVGGRWPSAGRRLLTHVRGGQHGRCCTPKLVVTVYLAGSLRTRSQFRPGLHDAFRRHPAESRRLRTGQGSRELCIPRKPRQGCRTQLPDQPADPNAPDTTNP